MKKIIEKYIPKMFGASSDEDGKLYKYVYKYELNTLLETLIYCKDLQLGWFQFEGVIIVELSTLLIKEDLNKFRGNGLTDFSLEIYKYKHK